MYPDIPLALSLVFIVAGLAALAWSSDVFVDGASVTAKALGISPFIIGMVVIGFGTSAPELCVSVMSGAAGHSNISLGNAYGSCSFNIAVILGVAALIRPIRTNPRTALVAGAGLALVSLFAWILLSDGQCSRANAFAFLAAFFVLMPLYCWYDQRAKNARAPVAAPDAPAPRAARRDVARGAVKVAAGLVVLVGSSHVLVWGAVDFAHWLGVSDLVVGLTVVAAGTSLPELASAIASARRGEHEFVLGNIIGSNLFNTLGVVGLATSISPIPPIAPEDGGFSRYILSRDLPVMALLSLTIALFGLNWRDPRAPGRIGRRPAVLWLAFFAAYTAVMFCQETGVLR